MKTKSLRYLFIACTIPLGFWAVSTLRLETNINAYNLASDHDIAAYESFVAAMEPPKSGETVMVLEKTTGWKTLPDFQLLQTITAFWGEQPEIEKASSISNLQYPKQGFFRVQSEPFLDLENATRFQKRLDLAERYADIFSKFVSRNGRYTLLFVNAPSGISPASVQALENLNLQKQGVRVHYIQYDLMQNELQSTMRRDTILLAAISLGLILIGFFGFTYSLRGLALIGAMVAFNIAATFLAMYALSMQFSLQMITIPCIITVLSFTDIMHILYHQQKAQATAKTNLELQQHILAAVRIPLFLTSLTNVVGFLVFLIFSNNTQLFNFSLAAIIGVTIAYLSARFLVIRLMGIERVFIKRTNFERLYSVHNRLSQWFWDRKKYMLPTFVTAAVLLLALVAAKLSIDGSEQEYALSGSKLTRGKTILQQDFFGEKQAEVFISLKEGSIWDKATLDQLEQIDTAINRIFQPLFINSPTVLVKRYHRFLRRGNPAAFFIPETIDADYAAQLKQHQSELGADGIVDSTGSTARILFGFGNRKLPEARAGYDQLRRVLRQHNTPKMHFELSGLQYLSDEATHSFSMKILVGLVLSILFGSTLVFFYLRSLRKSLGVLMVNLFPIFFALGLMLYLQLSVTPLTLFFLSILLGICVDDSIYLVMQNRKPDDALHVVPIFITSFVLALGFLSLAYSSFNWIKPFGWIFLLGIAWAYLLDLFVLPYFLNRRAIFGAKGL
ncbi:MAG: hypothetical protein IPL65_11385 [Lewinellaceae bacterium]|nr:hypothetical protein [Lewinellaceae bacterium]